jgi:hypothetical protein
MSAVTYPMPVRPAPVQRPLQSSMGTTDPLYPVPTARPKIVDPQSGRIRAMVTARNITIIILAFIAIFVGRLLISVATDANAYAIAEKSQLSQNLTRDAQFLQEQLNVLNSPQNLSAVATQLGMISNSNPAYLRISDGKMWGNAQVVSSGLDDRTTIANVLLGTMLPAQSEQGVSTDSKSPRGAESVEQAGVGAGSQTSAIPAPKTH